MQLLSVTALPGMFCLGHVFEQRQESRVLLYLQTVPPEDGNQLARYVSGKHRGNESLNTLLGVCFFVQFCSCA